MKPKITLKLLNKKVNRLREEVKDLREMIFKWGNRDREELEELKSKIKEMK